MAATRLSPAASLLRNSRLFALPAAINLPAIEPSSELVTGSDTATTLYPVRPAIETPATSLQRGDWGLKRPLPTKTTMKSGTPVIRIQGGIDTPEHIADFESAADHVITARKFQELNMRFSLPDSRGAYNPEHDYKSVFSADADHTTTLPVLDFSNQLAPDSWLQKPSDERAQELPSHLRAALDEARTRPETPSTSSIPLRQPTPTNAGSNETAPIKRWRFEGPYLAGLNGMQFDAFMRNITPQKREAFRQVVKTDLVRRRREGERAEALEQGTVFDEAQLKDVTEEDVNDHLRRLRTEPSTFGTLIANFFDLADGPAPPTGRRDAWHYNRDLGSADKYREQGPPATHPSGGLSYLKHLRHRTNDPLTGPRDDIMPVVARHLKSHQVRNRYTPDIGVAGFTVSKLSRAGATDKLWKWQPQRGGPKLVVSPSRATVGSDGRVLLQVKHLVDWTVVDDKPVAKQEIALTKAREEAAARAKDLEGAQKRSAQLPEYKTRTQPVERPGNLKNAEEELLELQRLTSRNPLDSLGN